MLKPVLLLLPTIKNPDWKLKLMLVRCRHEEKWEIMERDADVKLSGRMAGALIQGMW